MKFPYFKNRKKAEKYIKMFKKKNLDEKEKDLISAETQTFSLIRSKFVITGSSH